MNILFMLIPLSLALLGVAVWALFWAIDAGQFEDLDRAARSIQNDEAAGEEASAGAPAGAVQEASSSRTRASNSSA
jgi:cbb3-type cytochrome oxidase maturation protein